jgi:hypothetical protein
VTGFFYVWWFCGALDFRATFSATGIFAAIEPDAG